MGARCQVSDVTEHLSCAGLFTHKSVFNIFLLECWLCQDWTIVSTPELRDGSAEMNWPSEERRLSEDGA